MATGLNLRKAKLAGAVLTSLTSVLMSINLQAGETRRRAEGEVTVCMESGISRESALAQVIAKKMFADIGVTVNFHRENKCPANQDGIIHIRLETGMLAAHFPGALAYTMPYEGVHIIVFIDRVRKLVDPNRAPNLLAHVLAHEVTHILQGINRHSERGVMKAQWDEADHRKMGWKPLAFTEEDIMLIRFGLKARAIRENGTNRLATIDASDALRTK
jgi:hypothetical protein